MRTINKEEEIKKYWRTKIKAISKIKLSQIPEEYDKIHGKKTFPIRTQIIPRFTVIVGDKGLATDSERENGDILYDVLIYYKEDITTEPLTHEVTDSTTTPTVE